MAALTISFSRRPSDRLDLSALTPARLAGLSARDIAALSVGTDKRGARLGDIAAISGDDFSNIRITGGGDRLDSIGAGLTDGTIHVEGDAGRLLGKGMKSGRITVTGHVGPLAGSGMTGGLIDISGDADDQLGGAVSGAMAGQAGGLILVRGRAGHRVGDRMKRGTIAILGGAGDHCGSRMAGGTILAPEVGNQPGVLMKRGTLIIGRHGELLPTFVEAGGYELPFLALLRRWLSAEALEAASLVPARANRLRGDMATLGKGEILVGG